MAREFEAFEIKVVEKIQMELQRHEIMGFTPQQFSEVYFGSAKAYEAYVKRKRFPMTVNFLKMVKRFEWDIQEFMDLV